MSYAKTVDEFEATIAEYAGSKYAVAVESCCAAIFLSLKYIKIDKTFPPVFLPKFTYPGVACSIINAGGKIEFEDSPWQGRYQLKPYPIWDSALHFKRGMYVPGSYYCLTFHIKKHLPIGRGGMILTDNYEAYKWLRRARFDGREDIPLSQDKIEMIGWNMYLTKEQATRGMMLFEIIKNKDLPDLDSTKQGYPNLSTIEVYK